MSLDMRDDQYALSLLGSNSDDDQYTTPRSANGSVAAYAGRPYAKPSAATAGVRQVTFARVVYKFK